MAEQNNPNNANIHHNYEYYDEIINDPKRTDEVLLSDEIVHLRDMFRGGNYDQRFDFLRSIVSNRTMRALLMVWSDTNDILTTREAILLARAIAQQNTIKYLLLNMKAMTTADDVVELQMALRSCTNLQMLSLDVYAQNDENASLSVDFLIRLLDENRSIRKIEIDLNVPSDDNEILRFKKGINNQLYDSLSQDRVDEDGPSALEKVDIRFFVNGVEEPVTLDTETLIRLEINRFCFSRQRFRVQIDQTFRDGEAVIDWNVRRSIVSLSYVWIHGLPCEYESTCLKISIEALAPGCLFDFEFTVGIFSEELPVAVVFGRDIYNIYDVRIVD